MENKRRNVLCIERTGSGRVFVAWCYFEYLRQLILMTFTLHIRDRSRTILSIFASSLFPKYWCNALPKRFNYLTIFAFCSYSIWKFSNTVFRFSLVPLFICFLVIPWCSSENYQYKPCQLGIVARVVNTLFFFLFLSWQNSDNDYYL